MHFHIPKANAILKSNVLLLTFSKFFSNRACNYEEWFINWLCRVLRPLTASFGSVIRLSFLTCLAGVLRLFKECKCPCLNGRDILAKKSEEDPALAKGILGDQSNSAQHR